MIELHRPEEPEPFSDKIENQLEELVISHKVYRHPESHTKNLPYLKENRTIVTGKKTIKQFLKELSRELNEQRMVSGDSCYIDPETDKVC